MTPTPQSGHAHAHAYSCIKCLMRTYALLTPLAILAQASQRLSPSQSSTQLHSRCANGTRLIFAVVVLTAPDLWIHPQQSRRPSLQSLCYANGLECLMTSSAASPQALGDYHDANDKSLSYHINHGNKPFSTYHAHSSKTPTQQQNSPGPPRLSRGPTTHYVGHHGSRAV
jgi:hypothetical protein